MTKTIEELKKLLSQGHPGLTAWNKMMPGLHPLHHDYSTDGMIPSAVLIALYSVKGKWHFPLIQRVEDGFAHSGQISFPGGRLNNGERPKDAAIREAYEEIGIPIDSPQIIAELTPFPIHVSNHLVYPFVAVLKDKPNWLPEPKEVAEIFEISLEDICDQNIKTEDWELSTRGLSPVPFYSLAQKKVWGATAMILRELQDLLEK